MKVETLKKNLIEKFAGKELNDETTTAIKEEITKALAAGYDTGESPAEVKEVDPSASIQAAPAAEAPVAPEAPKVEAAPAPQPGNEVKHVAFKGDLFRQYSLGATLKQSPSGNVMTGIKKSPIDYVAQEKKIIRNERITSEDLAKLGKK